MEAEISLVEIVNILKKRVGIIINLSLIGLLLMAIFTFFLTTPQYNSTTQLLVNRNQQSEVIQRSDIDTNLQLINTYKDIIKGPVILDEVRDTLNLSVSHSELSDKINISSETNSQVFSIKVIGENPYDAAIIANTTANVFQNNLDSIMNIDNVTIISEAEADLNPVSPNQLLNLIIGVLVGFAVGVSLALFLELIDKTVKEESFIVEELGWTSLGNVFEMSEEELRSSGRQEVSLRNSSASAANQRV